MDVIRIFENLFFSSTKICLFVCFDALHPSQQFSVMLISCLSGLNQY